MYNVKILYLLIQECLWDNNHIFLACAQLPIHQNYQNKYLHIVVSFKIKLLVSYPMLTWKTSYKFDD